MTRHVPFVCSFIHVLRLKAGPVFHSGPSQARDMTPQGVCPPSGELPSQEPSTAVADTSRKPAVADPPREPAVADVAPRVPSTAEVSEVGLLLERVGVETAAEGSVCHSVAGDTLPSGGESEADQTAVAARRQQVCAPRDPVHGTPSSGHQSSWWNAEPEVGNFGLFVGNWGARCSMANDARKRANRDRHDRQILKSPAQVLVLCEANEQVEGLLKQPPVPGSLGAAGLKGRSTHEHWVVRGNEEKTAVLIAARKDNCLSLECLEYDVHHDHPYTEKGKQKQATSRMLACRVGFKQNIGHIGKTIGVIGVHGHFRTMKFEWPKALIAFWDRLRDKIIKHHLDFVVGDFNMCLTEVVKQLRSRGLQCDCIAWHPWRHNTTLVQGQPLGIDSCGIFYIGGAVQVTMPWSLKQIDILTAVADDVERLCAEANLELDVYSGTNHPGQHWAAYRSRALKEAPHEKNLNQRLQDLLTPSTTPGQLERIPKRRGVSYCPYLRFHQKAMDKNEWLTEGGVHNGAHFPLCVFTHNASARSADKAVERAQKRKGKAKGGKGDRRGEAGRSIPAVAANTGPGNSMGPGEAWSWSAWSSASWHGSS